MKHIKAINRKAKRVEDYVAAEAGDVFALQQGPPPQQRPHYPMGCSLVFSPGWEVDATGGTAGLCQPVERDLYDCYISCFWPAQVPDHLNNYPDWTSKCASATKDWRKIDLVFPSIVALLLSLSLILFSPLRLNSVSAQDKKMTANDLVSRHLESIGNAEARAKAETRVASGTSKLIIRIGGAANTDGQAMMVSSGVKFRLGLKFGLADYPGEDMAFDGAKTATGFLTQGRRSNLSVFLNSQNLPLREGLLGGALSTTWPLLRLDQSQPKLDYRGLKKVDGRQLHEISYRPRKGSTDLKVSLYFDPETFRHVKTKYSFEIGASIGAREDPNQNPESHYSLTEDFDDFRAVNSLTLPHKYRLQYSAESKNGSALYDWSVTINQITHNTKIDDEVFVIR